MNKCNETLLVLAFLKLLYLELGDTEERWMTWINYQMAVKSYPKQFIFFNLCSVDMYLCENRYAEIRRAGVTGICELPDLGAGIKI